MAVDAQTRVELAQKYSLPPPLILALEGQKPPPGLLASYGIDQKTADKDPAVLLMVMAHAVSQSFAQHGSLEGALSHVLSGDPHAHASPTSAVGGQVMGILATAATKVSHGWDNYVPAKTEVFGKVAEQFGSFLKETRDMGGVVTDDALKFWHQTVARVAPPTKTAPPMGGATGADHGAPVPKGPKSSDVEKFAGEMKGLGIDISHFMEHFPALSAFRYKMLSSPTKLSDYAPVNGLKREEILQHVRQQPHPTYPHITAGQYSDMNETATLHSITRQGRTPHPAEIASLVSAGAKWGEIKEHYSQPGKPQ